MMMTLTARGQSALDTSVSVVPSQFRKRSRSGDGVRRTHCSSSQGGPTCAVIALKCPHIQVTIVDLNQASTLR